MKIKSYYISLLHICLLCSFMISCRQTAKDDIVKNTNQVYAAQQSERTGSLEQINKSGKIRALNIPTDISFAGEAVPMGDIDVYERFDRELYVNTFWHSSTILLLKRTSRWLPQVSEILKENDVPDDFKYLAVIESGLLNVVSPSNAVGFWQILKPTGKELGLEINREVDERYDPIKSTYAAVKYIKKSYETFGSWTNVAASYNRGVNGLRRDLKAQQVDSYYDLNLNEETSRYVFRILAIKELLERPQHYGFDISTEQQYQPEETYSYPVTETIKDLSTFSIEHGINLKLLKRYNPWLRENKLTVSRKKTYTILLPVQDTSNESVAVN